MYRFVTATCTFGVVLSDDVQVGVSLLWIYLCKKVY